MKYQLVDSSHAERSINTLALYPGFWYLSFGDPALQSPTHMVAGIQPYCLTIWVRRMGTSKRPHRLKICSDTDINIIKQQSLVLAPSLQ